MIKNIQSLYRLILIILLINGCAHNSELSSESLASYNKSIQQLNLSSSFAFAIDGHDYYFVSAQTEGYLNDCNRFDGFKDDKLTYSFSSKQLLQLDTLYRSNLEIGSKIKEALKQIENFSPRLYICEPKLSSREISLPEKILQKGLEFIIYGTLAVMVLPIAAPAIINDSIIDHDLHKKLPKIRLGDSYNQVNEIMKLDSHEEKVSEYLIQRFDFAESFKTHHRRLVFIYKNNKVIAYVWGLGA